MAKDELILMAEPRTVHGKKVKRLRREGLVPGVVYGPVVDETVSVSVSSRDFGKFYMKHGHSTIFTLKWDGGSQPVLIREVQQDPVRQDILHVDFFAPNMRVTLRQNVAVSLHNAAELDAGGVMQTLLNEIEVEALPSDLPNEIVADISGLVAVGDSIHVSDIQAPQGVTIITDAEEMVASIVAEAAPVEEEEEAEEAEGEEGEGAEGEDAESTEGGEAESSDED